MGEQEKKISDIRGKYLIAMQEGREMRDATWTQARFVITTQRIVVMGADEHRLSLSLADLDDFEGRCDVNQNCATEGSYTALRYDEDVVLLSAPEQTVFENDIYTGALNGGYLKIKHPAVVGGVVSDESWQTGRIKVGDEKIMLVMEDGRRTMVHYDDIGEMQRSTTTVEGDSRTIIEVEHTDTVGDSEQVASVETHVTASATQQLFLSHLLERSLSDITMQDADLSGLEVQLLIALYSGVEPWELDDFVGEDPETVEEVLDRLIELDIVDLVRTRQEVMLTSSGRRIASESMTSE
jgi:helix-turn-helix protein